eukprot:CAMPEP_0184678516 /NCGR_PEP_ID=MMETSP0312-20130426/1271_1 /TAXON_ID=31354 /ORGANISM="Compsopogon coeruleus, Strain SAG 36.94" /LENGTH=255 /DNA_ID=CAMNT_0027127323 /DNA_START=83 /DNA_END=850 /DNA_ORIENTATION=+
MGNCVSSSKPEVQDSSAEVSHLQEPPKPAKPTYYVGPADGHQEQSSEGFFDTRPVTTVPKPEGVIRELKARCIKVYDGDTITCVVDIPENDVPTKVRTLVLELKQAISDGNKSEASSINRQLKELGFSWEKASDKIYRQFRVRVRGIDAPEASQSFGVVAANYTRALCGDRNVTLRIYTTDQYGRTVADVLTDEGKLLQHELLRAGMVWHYGRHDKRPDFHELEEEARRLRKGLWSEDNPIPPWDYRRKNRGDGE